MSKFVSTPFILLSIVLAIFSSNAVARISPIELELKLYDCARSNQAACFETSNSRLNPYYSLNDVKSISEKQKERAKILRQECEKDYIKSCTDLAVALFIQQANDNPEVLSLLVRGCDNGDSWACALMADHSTYLSEIAGPRYSKFYDEQAEACSAGKQNACATHARLNFLLNNVVPKKSIWYDQLLAACRANVSRACVNLSHMLSRDGVQDYLALDPKLDVLSRNNRRRALSYAKKACLLDNPVGCWNAGLAFDVGEGAGKDWSTAYSFFTKACALKYFEACEELNYESYWRLSDSEADLKVACSKGDFNACLLNLEKSKLVKKTNKTDESNAELPAEYESKLNQICLMGSARACGNASVLARHKGQIDKAERLGSVACSREQSQGCVVVGNVWKFDRSSDGHHAIAVEYLQRACDMKNMVGCNNVGDSYRKGLGVKVDKARATRLFTIACNSDLAVGCRNLSAISEEAESGSNKP